MGVISIGLRPGGSRAPLGFNILLGVSISFQQGLHVADALYFDGEDIPAHPADPTDKASSIALPLGYDYDRCNADVLLNHLTVKDGRLTLPSGMSYKALILPSDDKMTPEVLRKVKELAEVGAIILGPKPVTSPSLSNYPQCDKEILQLAGKLWDNGKIISGQTPNQVFSKIELKPDFEFADDSGSLEYIHRVSGAANIYFVSNQKNAYEDTDCTFRVSGKVPEIWHPDTGKIEKAAVYTEADGRVRIPMRFDPTGSVFVVFRDKATSSDHPVAISRSGGMRPQHLRIFRLVVRYMGRLAKEKARWRMT